MSKKLSQDEVLNKMQELEPNYDFSKFKYINALTKSIITCDKEHEYMSTFNNFKRGRRCPICSGSSCNYTQEYILNKLKQLEPSYNFSKFVYKDAKYKSTVICNKGHEYEVNWSNFINGKRCPHCSNNKSKPETEIIEFIKTFYDGTIEQSNRNIIKNHMTNRYLELDIYLPELKLAIEFNGRYYHTDDKVKVNGWNSVEEKHIMKTIYCKAKGIDLLHIDENNWIKDKYKELNRIQEFLR